MPVRVHESGSKITNDGADIEFYEVAFTLNDFDQFKRYAEPNHDETAGPLFTDSFHGDTRIVSVCRTYRTPGKNQDGMVSRFMVATERDFHDNCSYCFTHLGT